MKTTTIVLAAAMVAAQIGTAQAADPTKIDLTPIALVPVPNDNRCQYVIFNATEDDGTVDGQRFENGRCVPIGKPVPLSKAPCRLGDKEGTQKGFLDSKGRKVIAHAIKRNENYIGKTKAADPEGDDAEYGVIAESSQNRTLRNIK